MANDKSNIRIWCIGSDGTEYYAAHSEEEMCKWYIATVGAEMADEDLREYFRELSPEEMDAEVIFGDERAVTTFRKLAEACELPTQISTGYG